MKTINTLIKDVYDVAGRETWFDPQLAERYSQEMGIRVLGRLSERREVPRLRLSQMGDGCPKSLWASIHSPSIREKFPPNVLIKFHFGDVVEAMAIALAKAAGHLVTGEQDELELDGVLGHRDCVIDGNIVDVKSVNSLSFQKIKNKAVAEDTFLRSYLDQLDGYVVASLEDPLVTNHTTAYIWAVDKVLGHMCLYEHKIRPDRIRQRIADYKSIVKRENPPECTCGTVREGASGNIKLDLKASYNPYKRFCFPNLRTFYYADGKDGKIIHLVHVAREPRVPEIDKNGNFMVQ